MTKVFSQLNNFILAIIAFCVFFLIACSKNGGDVVPPLNPPVTPPDSMVISLNPLYPGAPGNNSQYELIISTADGSILVDTMLDKSKSASISYKTTSKLVDLTTIDSNNFRHKYWVNTYKGVNPSQWDTLVFGRGYETVGSSSYSKATLHYYNVPANNNYIVQFSSTFGTTSYGWSIGPSAMDVQYEQHPEVPVYLLFPTLALYKLYYPTSLADTVNLAVMDTAVKQKFTINPATKLDYVTLSGLLDTTNYAKAVMLYQPGNFSYYGADIEYPSKYVEKYQLRISATNSNQDIINHFSYGDTVAHNFNFPDQTNYNLIATEKDNFSVQFINANPTYYTSAWENDQFYFEIYASKDSISLNPQRIIDHLKSRSHFLSGDFSSLSIKRFTFETMKNVDYSSYMGYTFNSGIRAKRIIYWSDQLMKTF